MQKKAYDTLTSDEYRQRMEPYFDKSQTLTESATGAWEEGLVSIDEGQGAFDTSTQVETFMNTCQQQGSD